MNVNNNASANTNYGFRANDYDPKEAEVARKLGMTVEVSRVDFSLPTYFG